MDGERLICEFKLKPEAPFDVMGEKYYLYLEGNKVMDKEKASGYFDTGSAEPQDFWGILTEDKGGSGKKKGSGSSPIQPKMIVIMMLVAAATYVAVRR
jgi:hypothetical protein